MTPLSHFRHVTFKNPLVLLNFQNHFFECPYDFAHCLLSKILNCRMYQRFGLLFQKINECPYVYPSFGFRWLQPASQPLLDVEYNPRTTTLLSRRFQDASKTPPNRPRCLQDASEMPPRDLQELP